MTTVKHPEVHVPLVGHDGNAFAILGSVTRALRRAGVPQAERDAFFAEATAGDYDHLLQTVMSWVSTSSASDDYDLDEEDDESDD